MFGFDGLHYLRAISWQPVSSQCSPSYPLTPSPLEAVAALRCWAQPLNLLHFFLQDHKYFDSADWGMQKDAAAKGQPPVPDEDKVEELPAKLKPSPPTSRRVSHMDSMETNRDLAP